MQRFGPPLRFTGASPWPWVDHSASGLLRATVSPVSDSLSLRLPRLSGLTSLHIVTHRLIMQKARRQALSRRIETIALRLLVSSRFQVLFHSPHRGTFHLSLTVLVHYWSPNVFSLGEWTPQLPAGLTCPAVLRYSAGDISFSHTGLLPSLVGFPTPFC